MKVEIVEPSIKLGEYVWWGSLGVLAFLGQLATVVILVLLFLISGDTYKRKLVKITGPTLSTKKITVQILDDINIQIRRHLVVLVLSGIFVGLGTWGHSCGLDWSKQRYGDSLLGWLVRYPTWGHWWCSLLP